MKIEEIKELIQALEQSTLTSLEVSQGNDSVRLEKNYTAAPAAGTVAAGTVAPSISTPILAETAAEPTVPTEESAAPQPTGIAVTCPLVGVFYAAAAPEDMPFVAVGSTVKKGYVLCIVEAMKLMNEITAEKDGVITQICVENGQVVEYGQPLFYLA